MCFLAGLAVGLISGISEGRANQTSVESVVKPAEKRWGLDLPAQPVEEALYRLSVITGIQIFADGQVVAGRQAKAISGEYTVDEALERLLSGTGLVTRSAESGAIMVLSGLSGTEGEALRRSYSTMLQHAVLTALCRDGELVLGAHRLAFRMWLTPRGHVERIDLLSSTGELQRDHRVSRILRSVVAEPPPLALPQPVIMVILPKPRQDSGDCNLANYPTRLP